MSGRTMFHKQPCKDALTLFVSLEMTQNEVLERIKANSVVSETNTSDKQSSE